ncbi:MAG: ABC transporter substrate-binding protein [Actinomycetota bacterium]|nr:ABC transporter substrate-binding protein [Actinomycetota bacterium]
MGLVRGRRSRGVVVLVVALALLATACGTTEKESSPTTAAPGGPPTSAKRGGVWKEPWGPPATLDPGMAYEGLGIKGVHILFTGLVTFEDNPELAVSPGVAERWSSNADCSQWTFNLRRSTFSNGEPVTAESFIRGWTRAADGRSASQVAARFAGIEGYEALHGTATSPPTATTFSGLSAPDPHTLLVRLSSPECEFHKRMVDTVFSPVPTVVGAPNNNKEYTDAPIGNGEFMVKPGTKLESGRGLSLVRNDSYFGPKPSLDGLELVFGPPQGAPQAQMDGFRAGNIDRASPQAGQRKQAEATYGPQGGFLKRLPYTTNFLIANNAKPPFNSPDARKAISLALDREAIGQAIGEGTWLPATALIPPPWAAFHQPGVCDVCRLDVARAKELAARSGLTPGTRIRLLSSGPVAEAQKDQLEKNLGISVEIDSAPAADARAKRRSGDFELSMGGWAGDWPTPDTFLFPVLGPGAENFSRYDNAEFNGLIQQARRQKNDAERKRLYQAAERIAIGRDLAVIPTFWAYSLTVYDASKWTGVDFDFIGHGAVTFSKISLK